MGRIGTLVTVKQDGNRDTLTLTENGRTLETRSVPMEFLPDGTGAHPAQGALAMVREHPLFGDNYTVQWLGRGYLVVLK